MGIVEAGPPNQCQKSGGDVGETPPLRIPSASSLPGFPTDNALIEAPAEEETTLAALGETEVEEEETVPPAQAMSLPSAEDVEEESRSSKHLKLFREEPAWTESLAELALQDGEDHLMSILEAPLFLTGLGGGSGTCAVLEPEPTAHRDLTVPPVLPSSGHPTPSPLAQLCAQPRRGPDSYSVCDRGQLGFRNTAAAARACRGRQQRCCEEGTWAP